MNFVLAFLLFCAVFSAAQTLNGNTLSVSVLGALSASQVGGSSGPAPAVCGGSIPMSVSLSGNSATNSQLTISSSSSSFLAASLHVPLSAPASSASTRSYANCVLTLSLTVPSGYQVSVSSVTGTLEATLLDSAVLGTVQHYASFSSINKEATLITFAVPDFALSNERVSLSASFMGSSTSACGTGAAQVLYLTMINSVYLGSQFQYLGSAAAGHTVNVGPFSPSQTQSYTYKLNWHTCSR